MGRPRAYLPSYDSKWGSTVIPPWAPPLPAALPVVPQVGLLTQADLLTWALNQIGIAPAVSLYTNAELVPTQESVLTDFTAAAADGLHDVPIGSTTRPKMDLLGRADWTWPVVNMSSTLGPFPITVWGYFVYCQDPWAGAAALLFAQALPVPFEFISSVDVLPLNLAESLGAC